MRNHILDSDLTKWLVTYSKVLLTWSPGLTIQSQKLPLPIVCEELVTCSPVSES
jgi:hypothetical protein